MLFSTAESHEIIAQRLGVDDRTLWFAEIDPGVACSTPNCPFPALKRNGCEGDIKVAQSVGSATRNVSR